MIARSLGHYIVVSKAGPALRCASEADAIEQIDQFDHEIDAVYRIDRAAGSGCDVTDEFRRAVADQYAKAGEDPDDWPYYIADFVGDVIVAACKRDWDAQQRDNRRYGATDRAQHSTHWGRL